MLCLHFTEATMIGEWHRVVVAHDVRRVRLGGRRPLFEPTQDFGRLIVERGDATVRGTPAHQPYPSIAFGQISGQSFHTRQIAQRMFGVAGGAKRCHIPHDLFVAQWHSRSHGFGKGSGGGDRRTSCGYARNRRTK